MECPSMYGHLCNTLRCDWLFFLVELTIAGRIHTPQQPSSHSTGENRRRAELSKSKLQKHKQSIITGRCNDLIPRTARYHEKARVVVRRRGRSEGKHPPRKAGPRGSNRPMGAARKAKQPEKSGSISQTERSNLGETKATTVR